MIYSKEKLEKLQHRWTTPSGKKILKLIKSTRCYLSPALFREKVHNLPGINDAEIENKVDLRGAPLLGFDFRVPIQEGDDGFSEDIAILSDIRFEGAILKYSNFQNGKIHDCFFEQCDLTHAEFKNSNINSCNFQQANCSNLNLIGSRLINCNFSDAIIKDIAMDSIIVDPKTTFGKDLHSEKEGHYHFASIEHKQIKQVYKNSSLHDIADHHHYKEMIAKRKLHRMTSFARWSNYFFGDLLCKYGTSFVRVLEWAFVVIITCGLLFLKPNSISFHGEALKASFVDSLYFSLVTFTTLGYGDFHPIGAMRFLASFEALLGAALISLFTVIVARKIIRE